MTRAGWCDTVARDADDAAPQAENELVPAQGVCDIDGRTRAPHDELQRGSDQHARLDPRQPKGVGALDFVVRGHRESIDQLGMGLEEDGQEDHSGSRDLAAPHGEPEQVEREHVTHLRARTDATDVATVSTGARGWCRTECARRAAPERINLKLCAPPESEPESAIPKHDEC